MYVHNLDKKQTTLLIKESQGTTINNFALSNEDLNRIIYDTV